MKRFIKYFHLLAVLLLLSSCSGRKSRDSHEISILQFNIWQEGTVVNGGFDAIADEIARLDPDFVTLSEVRNYDGTRFCDRIVAALKQRGKQYHSFYSDDTGLLSRYEITDSAVVFPLDNDHGSIYRLNAVVDGHDYAVYTGHLDYLNDTYYEVRGYDGSTWQRLDAPVTDIDTLFARNARSRRETAVRTFLADADRQTARGATVIFGGDFNEPSLFDWTEATCNTADHHGVVIAWPCTRMLQEAGFVDAYRAAHPDPRTHPGYTFPSFNDSIQINRLTWAPEADERDRIDYVFYRSPSAISVKEAFIVGPRDEISRSRRVAPSGADSILQPLGVWPSDHKAVFVRLAVDAR